MNLLCKPLSLNFVQKFGIQEKRGTPFWHDVIEDSMRSHLESATTLATRILQKNEKKLLKLKRKPCNSAAIAPVRFVEANSLKIIKFSLVSGHFWRKFPHFSKKMATIALLQGFLEKFGIMASILYISAGFRLPRGTPKIMKIHENLSREPPSAPNWLPGPSQDPPGIDFS